jgi:hypothetical protein
MNAERLHAIALALRQELDQRRVVGNLEALVSNCQQLAQNTNNTSVQQNFRNARDSFNTAVTDTPSGSFSPAWRQILVELGGEDLFGRRLKDRVEKIINANLPTLVVAHDQLNAILTALRSFQQSLTWLTDALNGLKIGSEKLAPGEAEVGFLIPRDAVDNKLVEFSEELEEMEFILNTFSEVATGHTDDLQIKTISSSGLMVFLAASPKFGAIIAACVAFVVSTYKNILEIRKLSYEIDRLGLPAKIGEGAREHANTLMSSEIEKFAVEIISQYPLVDNEGRKNELTTQLKVSLKKMANRIDKGFNFEVRIEPPKALPNDEDEAKSLKKSVDTIQGASIQMQYMRLEGQPILSLPEGKPADEAKAPEEQTHRKRGKKHTEPEEGAK